MRIEDPKTPLEQLDNPPMLLAGTNPSAAARTASARQRGALPAFSMEGKVCVVTGAARGLGNLFAHTLVESGCNAIVLLDVDVKHAEEAAVELEQKFVKDGLAKEGEIAALGLGCDVANEELVKKAFDAIREMFGRIDVLVTAAGIVENIPAEDYPSDKFRKLMGINVEGTFYCAREAAKDMMSRNAPGSIIFIGSMSSCVVNQPQTQAPYNTSKAAVRHLADSLAVEWASKKIRVNVISPGYMETKLTGDLLEEDPELKKTWKDGTPLQRLGQPEDLKGAVIYFASDASSYTTGGDLRVDGGYTLT